MAEKPKFDRDAMRAQAQAQRNVSKQLATALKTEIAEQKAARKNPVAKYVDLPEQTGDAEEDAKADLTALQEGFRKRAADEGKRFALVTDSEFWSAICFQTRAQRDAFFAGLKVLDIGIGGRYFDGVAVAERLGIALPSADVPYKADGKPDPAWIEFINRPLPGK